MTSPTPARHFDNNQQHSHNSSSNSNNNNNNSNHHPHQSPAVVSVGAREQLVALRRSLPTHSELLRVCEQFPEDGERLSAYVFDVEHKIRELEAQRRNEQRAADRQRRDVAKETALEIERRKIREAEEQHEKRQQQAEANKRAKMREEVRARADKKLLEQSTAEQMEKYRKQREAEIEHEAQNRAEHWTEAIVHAKEQRFTIRRTMKERMEIEHRDWMRRVEQSRAHKEEQIQERIAEVAERNARLSNMAQHKHDLAVQARLRRETGKGERTQMVRAAVRRAEAANMAKVMNKLEENELRHDQIISEQKKRRNMRIIALRRDREMHREMALERLEKIKQTEEEKRHDVDSRATQDLTRHLQHHQEVRAEMERRIHETNERRSRAHHVVAESRKAELEEAARRIISRTAKVGTAIGALPPSNHQPGEYSILDEEVQRQLKNDQNSFRLNWEQKSRQRLHLDTGSSSNNSNNSPASASHTDPRSKPAIMRTQHLSPKLAPGGKSLEFILDLRPPKQQGPNLKLLAEAAKLASTSPPNAAAEKKKKEDEEKAKRQKEEAEKKKREEEEEAAAAVAAKQKREEQDAAAAAAAKKRKEEEDERQQQAAATSQPTSSSLSSSSSRLRALFIACSYKQTKEAAKELICYATEQSAATIATAMATLQNVLGPDNFRNRQVLVDDPSSSLYAHKTSGASHAEISAALDKLAADTKPGEAVVIFYAGADAISGAPTWSSCMVPSSSPVVAENSIERVITPLQFTSFLHRLPAGSRCTVMSSTPSGASLVPPGLLNEWKTPEDGSYKFVCAPNAHKGAADAHVAQFKAKIFSISAAPAGAVTLADAMATAFSSGGSTIKHSELFLRTRDALLNAKESAELIVGSSFVPAASDTEFFSFLAPPVDA